MTKKKESLLDTTKETVGVGVGVMAGHGILGAMSSAPGMPAQAQGTANIAGAGLNLIGIGQLAKVGMGLGRMVGDQAKPTTPVKKQTRQKQRKRVRMHDDDLVKKIWG